jgi:hypothetical protein
MVRGACCHTRFAGLTEPEKPHECTLERPRRKELKDFFYLTDSYPWKP